MTSAQACRRLDRATLEKPMSRIAVEDDRYVLVNVFKTSAPYQQRLIDIWKSLGPADERSPGLISVNAHVSFDGESVISYIQWRSKEDWQAILADPGRQERFKEVLTFSTFESIHCEVVHTQRSDAFSESPIEITTDQDYYVVLEMARVAPERQQELLDLVTAPNELLAATPGYISHSIHRAFDGTAVVNYSQWKSQAAYEAFRADEDTRNAQPDADALATVEQFALRIDYITEAAGL
jgi:heme-degrading monooxygenase HmoA